MRVFILSLSLTLLACSVGWGGGHKNTCRCPPRPLCEVESISQTRAIHSSPAREQIGEVLGKPVFRDEILEVDRKVPDSEVLHARFLTPLVEKYQQEHQKELTPSPQEIEAMVAFFRKNHPDWEKEALQSRKHLLELKEELKRIEARLEDATLSPEQRRELENEKSIGEAWLEVFNNEHWIQLALVTHWKFERHLYDNYGGGRILWQQIGLEAFDAMHNWLKSQEDHGHFKITDPQLHRSFYRYWRDMHHDFLISTEGDEELLRSEFLEPEWLRSTDIPREENSTPASP